MFALCRPQHHVSTPKGTPDILAGIDVGEIARGCRGIVLVISRGLPKNEIHEIREFLLNPVIVTKSTCYLQLSHSLYMLFGLYFSLANKTRSLADTNGKRTTGVRV